MPISRTNRVGRRSCITSPMQKAFFNKLTEQPYLYRCEMAEFFYCRFRKRISERLIGRTLGWTRTTIQAARASIVYVQCRLTHSECGDVHGKY
ncbi:hypothetical protein V8E51_018521 [Hyaloscypha variabilis]